MKKILSIIVLALAIAIVCGVCYAAPKGNIKVAGSNTLLPLSQIWAEVYMQENSGVSISISGGGSGQGITQLLNGTCDIANASRAAKQKEIDAARAKNVKLVATKVARDGLSIIVNPSNNVKNLTMRQLADIYSGRVKKWNQVGGDSDDEIVVIGRDSSSGTYGFFQDEVLAGGAYRSDMMSIPTTQAICQAVSQSKNAIGYVGVAYAHQFSEKGKARIVSLSRKKGEAGVKPTRETVMSGEYPLFRYLLMYTINAPSGASKDFIKFALSNEGQKLVEKSGYYPINK